MVFALQTAGQFQFATRQASETEALFTSVERLLYYIGEVPREPDTVSEDAKASALAAANALQEKAAGGQHAGDYSDSSASAQPAVGREWASDLGVPQSILALAPSWDRSKWPQAFSHWPAKGDVEFCSVSARYRPGLPRVLKHLSIRIPAGSRIGIVGRTGSGKSSLMLALFRMIDLAGGRITIDGVDIAGIPLGKLRSSQALVPQDPILFSGTVRYNLSPFGEYLDEAIWSALERVGLSKAVRATGHGLDAPVEDGGGNWSAGERQLMCLARAILRRAKVCVMDEATSSVSPAEDEVIQRAIREDLQGSTMLVVAHRLGTVMDSDAILALEHGRLAEYGHPAELLGLVDSKSRSESTRQDKPSADCSAVVARSGQDSSDSIPHVRGVRPGLLQLLVEQTGEETANLLRQQALQAYQAKFGSPL